MSNQWAIVAIPKKDDYVWRISSEKIPHMTILFLGEQPENTVTDKIVEYLSHTVETSLTQFGMSVDKRGELGPDNADVLFFDKHWSGNLEPFRSYLLANQDIKAMFDSTEQYPSWTPHLTLGYPETPAKKDDRDYPGIHWIEFDRIALWTGDYEGPTFELPTKSDTMEVAMSDPKVSALSHHGIKGMRWGVRRSDAQLRRAREGDSADFTRSRELKAKSKRTLSNTELQTVITRLNLEKQLGKLDPSAVQKGHAAIKGVLATAATVSSIVALANSPAVRAVKTKLKG